MLIRWFIMVICLLTTHCDCFSKQSRVSSVVGRTYKLFHIVFSSWWPMRGSQKLLTHLCCCDALCRPCSQYAPTRYNQEGSGQATVGAKFLGPEWHVCLQPVLHRVSRVCRGSILFQRIRNSEEIYVSDNDWSDTQEETWAIKFVFLKIDRELLSNHLQSDR